VIIPNSVVFFKISRDSKLPWIQDNRAIYLQKLWDGFAEFTVSFPVSREFTSREMVRSSPIRRDYSFYNIQEKPTSECLFPVNNPILKALDRMG
jgi:hypothetical protein